MASEHASHVYTLASLSDPLFASTHNTGYLHAFCASVQGLRDLDNQISRLRFAKENQVVHVLTPPENAPKVYVPLDVRV